MEPAISEYVAAVRSICSGNYTLPAKVRRIEEAAARTIARPLDLTPEMRFVPEGGYGRNLMYRDPDHGFVIIAMVWPAFTMGCPHDHMTWGVVAVSEGSIRVQNFQREDAGGDDAAASLVETSRLEGRPGDVGRVLPPHDDIHAISNPSAEPALSIHTYGRDIKRCRLFDPATGRVEWIDLSYHRHALAV
jgi:predicted metal-dependent enzyme (double-stranded beta helix superfamily)